MLGVEGQASLITDEVIAVIACRLRGLACALGKLQAEPTRAADYWEAVGPRRGLAHVTSSLSGSQDGGRGGGWQVGLRGEVIGWCVKVHDQVGFSSSPSSKSSPGQEGNHDGYLAP